MTARRRRNVCAGRRGAGCPRARRTRQAGRGDGRALAMDSAVDFVRLLTLEISCSLSRHPVKSEAPTAMLQSPSRVFPSAVLLALLLAFAGCAAPTEQTATQPTPQQQSAPNLPAELKPALDSVNADDLMRHTKTLASDEYEGRGPGTRGEELSVKYLTGEFQRMGLKPGNPDGTYVQKVPLAGLKAEPRLTLSAGGRQTELKYPDDYVAASRRFVPETRVENSDIVFVGYGVVAPEYGWDDYKGVDVKGKTIVMLINDPAVADAADPSKPDEKMFKGKAMTYYGRWTYKFEIASEKGAAAAIIVHETEPAGYGFEVVKNSWSQENFDIKSADG